MFFKKKPIEWDRVAGNVAFSLLHMMQGDMPSLAKQYARFILKKDGSVAMYFDERPPQHLLGWGDISFAFLRQDEAALKEWVNELKQSTGSPEFQIIATERFAMTLTRLLMQQVR